MKSRVLPFCPTTPFRRVTTLRPWIHLVAHNRPNGTEGIESLGARPLTILLLQVPGCHVVDHGISTDVLRNILIRSEMGAAFADYDRDFALKIHALRESGNANDSPWRK